MFFFFFSSRRRHTRLQGDWSSDVCSSDLLRSPELGDLEVVRTDAGYTYALPRALVGKVEHTPGALRELVGELRPLLLEMTGHVVVRRIEEIPSLQERAIISP